MRIRWTTLAAADLESIQQYLDFHYPHFSRATTRRLYEAALSLKTMPGRGRPGMIAGTRELMLHPLPYVVVYRVSKDTVEISAHLAWDTGS